MDQVTNSGVIGGDVTVTTSDPSGYPAKYRGLYFDGTHTAFIPLPAFTLYHTCSFHFWIIPMGDGVLFSKDRPSYVGVDTQRHLRLSLDTLRPKFRMANDDDTGTAQEEDAGVDYTLNAWLYLVVSVELDSN